VLETCLGEGSYGDGCGLLQTTQPSMEMVKAFYDGLEGSGGVNLVLHYL